MRRALSSSLVVVALLAGVAVARPEGVGEETLPGRPGSNVRLPEKPEKRLEWPAGRRDLASIALLEEKARQIAEAQKRLEAEAQAILDEVFAEAVQKHGAPKDARARLRFDPKAAVFYLEAAPSVAPVTSKP